MLHGLIIANAKVNFDEKILLIDKFIPYIDNHFKDKAKVNVIFAACSDGSETYSFIIGARENFKKSDFNKFLPINCYDIDREIIRAADSGYILLNMEDRFELKKQTKNITKYLQKEPYEVLKIQNNNLYTETGPNSIDTYKLETYKVHPKIKKHINFEEKDVFDVLESLEDDSNTILFFRNALGHLSDTTARCFAEEASKKLKKGSLLVIGDYDKKWTFIEKHLHENGFTEIMNNVWQKDSKAVESFKKLTARLKKAGRSMNIVFKN